MASLNDECIQFENKAKLRPLRSVYKFGGQCEAAVCEADNARLVSPVSGSGGGGVGLPVVLGVGRGSSVGVHRSLRLLEARPVRVGPGEGGGLEGGH